MLRPKVPTWDFKTPSGITVKLKKLTYGENKEILSGIMGETMVGENPTFTLNQAQELISKKLLKSVESWDLTEEDGSAIPLTKENFEAIFSEEDINALSTEIQSEASKKK